jgi:hypothetical protein
MDDDLQPGSGIRVRIVGPEGHGTLEHTVEPEQLDTTERGLQIGTLFVPWHRVISFESVFRQGFERDPAEDGLTKVTMRVVLNREGSLETHEVPSNRFEATDTHLTLLLDVRAEPLDGTVVMRRLSVPWHRVAEHERIVERVSLHEREGALPTRPDLSGSQARHR